MAISSTDRRAKRNFVEKDAVETSFENGHNQVIFLEL
jgi:hypothetical protein